MDGNLLLASTRSSCLGFPDAVSEARFHYCISCCVFSFGGSPSLGYALSVSAVHFNGISMVFLEEIWSKNLYHLLVSPLTPYHVILGAILTGILKVSLSSGLAIFLAYHFFSFSLFSIGLSLIPFVLALLCMGWALGILTTALILRFGQEAEVLAWGVIFLFQPVSAVFNPVSVLPPVFRNIAMFVPASHVFEGMRQVLNGGRFPGEQLMVAFLLDACYLLLALGIFGWVMARARREGFSLKLGA